MCKVCVGDVFGIESFLRAPRSRRRFIATSAAAAGVAAYGLSRRVQAAGQATTVFSGGPVITMDDTMSVVEALAISGNRIVAVGTRDDVLRAAGSEARKIDLDGRTLMPGLIDPHQHPIPGGIMLTQMMNIGYDTYKTKAEVWPR